MLAVFLIIMGFLSGCGVPEPQPQPAELERRAEAGDASAVEALVDALGQSADNEVRSAAYIALVKVGSKNPGTILKACRSTDSVQREHAIALAANLGLDGAFEEAAAALSDAAFPRRYVAAWALGHLGDDRAIDLLVAALAREQGEPLREIARALSKFGKRAAPRLLDALRNLTGENANHAIRILGEAQAAEASEALLAATSDVLLREAAVWALGKLGDPKVGPQLVPFLDDPSWRIRIEAARAVGNLGSKDAVPRLEILRETDPVISVRQWAARSLGTLSGTPKTYLNSRGEWAAPDELYR